MKVLTNGSSGWMYTDAVAWVSCPKCKQPPGVHCTQPKGRKATEPHTERMIEVKKDSRFDKSNYTGGRS